MKAFKLENEPKIATGFKISDEYFNDLSERVLAQIAENEFQVKVIPLYKRKKVIMALAAAVVVISFMIPLKNYYNESKELDAASLETYLAYQSSLNQFDLIRELDTKDIESINQNVALEQETLEDILALNPNIENLISE